MYLRKLWIQLNNFLAARRRATTLVVMSAGPPPDSKAPRTVTSAEFLSDTRSVVRRAEREGPIVVTDDRGTPRITIYCPREKLPVVD